MRANIRLLLAKLLPLGILALLDNVIAKLYSAAIFTTPPVTEAAAQALSAKLKAAIEAATHGSTAARKYRDNVVVEAKAMLRILANYVRSVCDGDAALLTLSGFDLAKQPQPISEVGVPGNLRAAAMSIPGCIELVWYKARGARMYRVEKSYVDPSTDKVEWITVELCARVRFVVRDMVPFEAVWFRVVAIGADGEGLPSDVVMGRAA